jgi:hypothetical protein
MLQKTYTFKKILIDLPAGWTGRRHWPIGMVVVSGIGVVTGIASVVVVMTKNISYNDYF